MQLSERQGAILRRVVEEFVSTEQPVGSKTLVERSDLRVSPSTVRAELAELEALEDYFERVVAQLTGAGYRWYETANFCRVDGARDLRAQHNLAYWLGRDYLGIGIGAVSTIESRRWRNTPKLGRYLSALAAGSAPERELEPLDGDVQARERVMLGLRLAEPLRVDGLRDALDPAGLERAERLGLALESEGTLTLTRRGRFLGGGVTAEILA